MRRLAVIVALWASAACAQYTNQWLPVSMDTNAMQVSPGAISNLFGGGSPGPTGPAGTNGAGAPDYIRGLEADWRTTNSVTLRAGECLAAGKMIGCTTQQVIWITTMTRSNEWHYIYANQAASTSNALVAYESTNVPIQMTNTTWGWYNPATNTDRALWFCVTTTNSYHLNQFATLLDGFALLQWVLCVNQAASASFVAPNQYDTDATTPVMAVMVGGRCRTGDADGTSELRISPYEAALQTNTLWYAQNPLVGTTALSGRYDEWRIPLGPTRKARFATEANDDAATVMIQTYLKVVR